MSAFDNSVGQPSSYMENGQSARTIYSSSRQQRTWCCPAESPLLPILVVFFRRTAPVYLGDLQVYTFDVDKKKKK